MCFTLTLAWQHFGRQRHVMFWALSYGISVVQWIFNTTGLLLKSDPLIFIASVCVLGSSSLVVIGARVRANMPVRWAQFLVGGGIAVIGCAVAHSPIGTRAMQSSIISAYTGVMMAAAAVAIWPRGRSFTAPEKAFFSMLIVFVLFECLVTAMGLALPNNGTGSAVMAYRYTLALGLPAIYVAMGVTSIVVIAGDLSSQLRTLISNDQLTGLLNRGGIDEAGARAIAYARRHERNLAAVMCDMDSFKDVNDGHGHIVGDAALRAFSRVLMSTIRQDDLAARFGGDEFCVLLLDASETEAAEVMERVRTGVEKLAVDRMAPGSISASFGVTALRPGDVSLDDLVARADRALYESKQRGRNRVTVWQAVQEAPTQPPRIKVAG